MCPQHAKRPAPQRPPGALARIAARGIAALGLACGAAVAQADEPVSFQRDVVPLLRRSCQGCHQPARAKGELDLTTYAALMRGGREGPAVVAGAPGESLLVELVTPFLGDPPDMPEKGDPLSEAERELLARWIAEGAVDDGPADAGPRYTADDPPVYPRPPVLTSLAFSADGTTLAVSGHHEVLLHRVAPDGSESELVARLVGLSPRVESLAFSPDGARLAVAGGAPGRIGELQVWSVPEAELERSLPLTADTLHGASWSPDGTLVAFGCAADRSLRAVDWKSGEEVLFQGAHVDWVLGTAFSLDGSHLVSVGRDRSMKLTLVATQQFIDNITSITPGALTGGLMSVERHPARDELLVGGADGTPRLYRMFREKKRVIGDDFNLIRAYEPLDGRVFAVRWSRDGARLAAVSSGRDGGLARAYAEAEPAPLWTGATPGGLYALAFHPDGAFLAVGGAEGVVRFLDAGTGEVLRELVPVPLAPEPAVPSDPQEQR